MDRNSSVVEGIVERILYQAEDWCVVKILLPDTGVITAVGSLAGIQPGENIRLYGNWIIDPKYGQQFKTTSYVMIKPATLVGIEKYLGSGLIKGIGPVMANRIVNHFGLKTLDVIEESPERLCEVEGIGKQRLADIKEAWDKQKEIKEVMIFLQSYGISSAIGVKIFKEYGKRAISVLRENPYRLATDVFGIGFKTADKIGENLGFSKTSPKRIEAGVHHLLLEREDGGDVCLPYDELAKEGAELLEVSRELVEEAIKSLEERGEVVIERWEDVGEVVFLKALHRAEVGVAERIKILLRVPQEPIRIDMEGAIEWFKRKSGVPLSSEQQEAIRQSIKNKVLIITGGPGTGKTTTVNGIIQILEQKGRVLALCAPTGRAAKRLQEATGREAKTIHRLLEYNPKKRSFERGVTNPLEVNLVIVDEFSMVDIVLFYNILKALKPTTQLILIGDVDQLPSIGPGNVLRDMIDSGVVNCVRLTKIFRQSSRSQIVLNAHRINQGVFPMINFKGGDFYFVEREEPKEVLDTIKHLVSTHIPKRFGIHPIRDIQVLTPMYKGIIGITNLNIELQRLLNPVGEALIHGAHRFRVGDKVMQIRNNYELEVFNGDIGWVEGVDRTASSLFVRYDSRVVKYELSDLNELVLAYACSVHKAQGNEYPAVILPVHLQHYILLQRNVLYTGITRGKKLVVLVGSKKALAIAVRNNRIKKRFTCLQNRLKA